MALCILIAILEPPNTHTDTQTVSDPHGDIAASGPWALLRLLLTERCSGPPILMAVASEGRKELCNFLN